MSDLVIVTLFCGGRWSLAWYGGRMVAGPGGMQKKERGRGRESSRLYEEIIWREVVLGSWSVLGRRMLMSGSQRQWPPL